MFKCNRENCKLYNEIFDNNCQALNEVYIIQEKCKFFKDKEDKNEKGNLHLRQMSGSGRSFGY